MIGGGRGVGVEMDRCLMDDHLLAEEGDAPQPVRGDRESRPAEWIGKRVKVSKAWKWLRSTAIRREMRA